MGKKLKIFFIDDDIALGHICTRIMQEEGYEVLYQTSLNGAKACIVETHPDMIVLDVEIGNKNGIEAVPELKAIAPNTPILFISSNVFIRCNKLRKKPAVESACILQINKTTGQSSQRRKHYPFAQQHTDDIDRPGTLSNSSVRTLDIAPVTETLD